MDRARIRQDRYSGAAAAASVPAYRNWQMLGVLSLLMGFASISTDLYLPAMPGMGRSLNAERNVIHHI